jgi:Carboxypeptidase regulatory-like domain
MMLALRMSRWMHRAAKVGLPRWTLLFFVSATAIAQLSSGPAGPTSAPNAKYSVSGTVVDSVTGEPVRRALVTVGEFAVLTDSGGAFQLDGLPPGEFGVTARKPGFFSEQDLTPSPLPPLIIKTGPNSAPVSLKLVPAGGILGRVVNGEGQGLEDLPVRVYQFRLMDGRKRWDQSRTTMTDEQGAFRIGSLQPGTYYLSAGPGYHRGWVRAPESTPARGYSELFYQAGHDLASANPLAVAPGQKVQADLLLKLENFYEVSGVVTGYEPSMGIGLSLTTETGSPLPLPIRIDRRAGEFHARVPRGTYKLRAMAQDSSATMHLTVHSDITGLQLALQPARIIPVITQAPPLRRENGRNMPQPWEMPAANVQLIPQSPSLQPSEYFIRPLGDQAHRLFGFQGVEPGTYFVQVTAVRAGYVQSVRCGDVDLLQEDLHVTSAPPEPIEVVIGDGPARLTGTVAGMQTKTPAGVLAVPDHGSIHRLQITYTAPDGTFQIPNLAPGEYSVLALDRLDSLEYRNAEVLGPYLSHAVHVTLAPNAEAKVTLNLVQVEK